MTKGSKDTSSFLQRGSRNGQILGRTSDGTRIVKPGFKPDGFTVRELQKVIRDVRKTEAKAG
jgi:hypothetical protein